MTTPVQSEIESELCVVCGDAADGYHYSVLSCRGCNSFFRRAATMNMKFVCRRDGNCAIDKNVRCACRSCRLAKCERVGMDRRAVQPKRDSNGHYNRKVKKENGHYNRKVKKTQTCSSPGSSRSTESTPSTPSAVPTTSAATMPTFVFEPIVTESRIDQLIARYAEQCRRRRSMLCSSLEEILSDWNPVVLRRPVAAEDHQQIFKVQMVLMFEWTEKLDEYKYLTDVHDKAQLLRRFALKWLVLDSCFYTVELGCTDRIVMVNNTYISAGCTFIDSVKDNADLKELKARLFGERSLRGLDEMVLPMIALGLTTAEMMALRVIAFWNCGDIGLSEAGSAIAKKASDAMISELFAWYGRNNFSDAPERLGNLMLLLPALVDHISMMKEDARIVKTFNLMEWDSFMDDLLRSW